MERFKVALLGVVLGLILGTTATAVAGSISDTGFLIGWDVVNKHGQKICSDPYAWTATHEIQCETE